MAWRGDADGEFMERDCGRWFTYRFTENAWAKAQGLLFEFDVLDGVRFAQILKTVAYVCVDEDAEGNAVIEKWFLKKNNFWKKEAA
jgi:hypothetical protein